jgi:hypothetical protein
MRAADRIILVSVVLFGSCAYGPEPRAGSSTPGRSIDIHDTTRPGAFRIVAAVDINPASFDIVQRTCALYVAVRSGSLESAVAFGRDIDDDMVRWNMCPSGTMVACASVSDHDAEPILPGIPWTHITGPDL